MCTTLQINLVRTVPSRYDVEIITNLGIGIELILSLTLNQGGISSVYPRIPISLRWNLGLTEKRLTPDANHHLYIYTGYRI